VTAVQSAFAKQATHASAAAVSHTGRRIDVPDWFSLWLGTMVVEIAAIVIAAFVVAKWWYGEADRSRQAAAALDNDV
jgi:hypothetical protein